MKHMKNFYNACYIVTSCIIGLAYLTYLKMDIWVLTQLNKIRKFK